MGSLSVSTHRGLVHWKGLLLLVLFLTFWSLPTTDEIRVSTKFAYEGQNVLLRIRDKPPEAVGIVWYKGKYVDKNNVIAFSMRASNLYLTGPGETGEQMLTDDGGLLLKNVTKDHVGMYTVAVQLPDSETQTGSGLLLLIESLSVPVVHARGCTDKGKLYAIVLNCYTKEHFIQWMFNDKNLLLKKRMTLTKNDKRLTIKRVRKVDAGVYKCKAWNTTMWIESEPLYLPLQKL